MAIVLDCFSLGYANLYSHKFTVYDKYQWTTIPTKSELLSLSLTTWQVARIYWEVEGKVMIYATVKRIFGMRWTLIFKKTANFSFVSLSSFNLIILLTCRPAFGIHMHNPPIELDAMDDVVGHILDMISDCNIIISQFHNFALDSGRSGLPCRS